MPVQGRRLAKSEKSKQDSLKAWIVGPEHDSDEYDTDLEDDFPPGEMFGFLFWFYN